MKLKKKIIDFIWNDLPLRLSTWLLALVGLIPTVVWIIISPNGFSHIPTHYGMGQLYYYIYIFTPAFILIFPILLIEFVIRKFRLNFKFFNNKIVKIFCLTLYFASIIPFYLFIAMLGVSLLIKN